MLAAIGGGLAVGLGTACQRIPAAAGPGSGAGATGAERSGAQLAGRELPGVVDGPPGSSSGGQPVAPGRWTLDLTPHVIAAGVAAPYRVQFATSDVAQIVAGIFDRTAPTTPGFVESLGYFNDGGAGLSTLDPLSAKAFFDLQAALGTAGGPAIPAGTNRADLRRWLCYRQTGSIPHTVTLTDFPLPGAEHQDTLFAAALDSYDAVVGLAEEDLTCCGPGDVISNTAGPNSAGLTVNLDYSGSAPDQLGSFQVADEFIGNGCSDLLVGAFDTSATPHFGFVGSPGTAIGSPSWLPLLAGALAARGYADTANARRYLVKDVVNPGSFASAGALFSNVPSIAQGAVFAVPIQGGAAGAGQFAAVSMASGSAAALPADVSLTTSNSVGTGLPGGYNTTVQPAASTQISGPYGVAVDAKGNVYFADYGNQRIRMLCNAAGSYFGVSGMQAGNVYTIAGDGSTGGGLQAGVAATSVPLDDPRGVAVDSGGNVYFADATSNVVQVVCNTPGTALGVSMATAGDIYTVAGSGYCCSPPGDGGAATSADLDNPGGVALDGSGDLFIADYAGDRIRFVCAATAACAGGGSGGTAYGQSTSAGAIYTIAGDGTPGAAGDGGAANLAQINLPQGVAVDGSGDVYIADSGNNSIRQVTPAGIISTLAGSTTAGSSDGIGSSAGFRTPRQVAVDSSGSILYVADSSNELVRAIQIATARVTTIAGSLGQTTGGSLPGFSLTVGLDEPYGLAMNGQSLVVALNGGDRLVQIQ